jgi:hypothetical protein
MHGERSAASNWPRSYALSPLLLSVILVLRAGAAIAGPALIVLPPTVAPDNVDSIQSGTCANYSNNLSTNGVSVNGVNHPGSCQLTDFEVLFISKPA